LKIVKEVWDGLKTWFPKYIKNFMNLNFFTRKFNIITMKKLKNGEKHIIEFCNLLNQLTTTRETILYGEFTCVLSGPMPNSLPSLIMANY